MANLRWKELLITLLFSGASVPALVRAQQGAEVVTFYGYDDCIRLSNETTTVTLCPAAGGRVLEYSQGDSNVLYLPPGSEGWRSSDGTRGKMDAGRFDIGPEKVVTRGDVLWQGPWAGEITGDRSARMTSEFDPKSGVRLVRDFQLHESSSRLRCTQTIRNESDRPVSLCHWSRTFAVGGGVAVVPRTPRGRFPHGYLMYRTGNEVLIEPEDANIQVSDEAVIITAAPQFPKLGFDSHAGWLAYLAPTNQMFVKRFKTYPDRAYNEFAGLTLSVWYPQREMVELEPIGPAENLEPGQKASFSEEWWLLPHDFPSDIQSVDFAAIRQKVRSNTVPALHNPEPPVSPQVHADRSATFRFTADDAKRLSVRIDGEELVLRQDADGLWQGTSKPLEPGIYEYSFDVDGVRVTDPRNRWVKKWKVCASVLEVPGDPPLLSEQQEVPHGTLHHHIYRSTPTGGERAAIIYTPPGYSQDSETVFPLLVLCHGNGDDETAWTEVGRAHWILDNLIAAGRIEPMVVVMPNGHPLPLIEHQWSEDYSDRNLRLMVQDIVEGVLPFVENNYRVSSEAGGRAITGLSMGGGQSIVTAMSHPEIFDWVGGFSASTPVDLKGENARLVGDIARHAERKLFWIACGKDDFLLKRNQDFVQELEESGIEHTYVQTDGSHNWGVWRRYLPEFLELIFNDSK